MPDERGTLSMMLASPWIVATGQRWKLVVLYVVTIVAMLSVLSTAIER